MRDIDTDALVIGAGPAGSAAALQLARSGIAVTLVDRLLHHAELVDIDGDSSRLQEAKERAASKSKARGAKRSA